MNLVIVSCLGVIKEEASFVRMFEQVFRDLNIESLCVVECCQSTGVFNYIANIARLAEWASVR